MLGYWLALAAALLETTIGVGLVLPGSVVVLFLGAFAAQGVMDLGDLIWFATIGAVLGDNINYLLGKKYGERWYREGVWFLGHDHFVKAKSLFDNYGGSSVFLGRFVPGIKEIAPIVAGIVRMNRTRFFIWNVLGAVGWSLEFLLTGYLVGHSLNLARLWISRIGFFVLLLLFAVVLLTFLRRWLLVKGIALFNFLASVLSSMTKSVKENREVGKLVVAHPALFRFIAGRLDQSTVNGLPLTILSLILFCLVFLFGGVVEDLIASDPIVAADVRTAHLLAVFRTPLLTGLMSFITLLGKWQIVTAVTAASFAALWLKGRRSYAIPLMGSLLWSQALSSITKMIFQRPRPDVALYLEHSYSFPSGHSAISISLYGFLAYILARESRSVKARANIVVAAVAIALFIGFSRLYLGEHYLSDVWGGYLTGATGLILGISAREIFCKNQRLLQDSQTSRGKNRAALGIIVAAVGFCGIFVSLYNPPIVVRPSRTEIRLKNLAGLFADARLRYSETITGEKDLPIQFVVAAGNDQKLLQAFSMAGWLKADGAGPRSLVTMELAMQRDRRYPQAPVSPSFWDSQINSLGLEKPTSKESARERYQARIWKTSFTFDSGKSVYVGTVCMEQGRKWLFTHRMSPDLDGARDKLFKELLGTGRIADSKKLAIEGKLLGENFTGDAFFADGQVVFLVLGP